MTPDRLRRQLAAMPVPDATAARERTVAAARAEIAEGQAALPSRPSGGRWPARLIVAAVLLVAAALSPPGRAATGWVGDLIGGEGRGGLQVTSRPVVIASGHAPDGTRYQWVAYGCKIDLHGDGVPVRFRGFSLSLDWPGARRHDRSCEGRGRRALRTAIDPGVLTRVPSGRGTDLYVSGRTAAAARRVRATYTDPGGRRHELPVDFARLDGRLRQRARVPRPVGTYVVFVPGSLAASDDLTRCVDVPALGGPRRRHRCAGRPGGKSPIQLIAYNAAGRELQRLGVPLSAADLRVLQPHVPSEAEQRRALLRAHRGAVVLLRGRAPEGARYEFTVKLQRERSGRVYGICFDLWWPHVARALSGGFCGPRIPPPGAFGHGRPERVGAKAFGFLGNAKPATSRLTLSGFARASVTRVRVVFETRDGARRDAPVNFVRVRGALRRRVGAHGSFGFWVAFLPRYVAGARARRGRHAIEVIAYGNRGDELSRVGQPTSPVNGLARVPRRR
jgi:hypothetical protein